MAEYGHFGSITNGCSIDAWGAGPFTLRDKDRQWSFEFSDRFGPVLLDKDGEPLRRQPISPRHPFWKPFNAWLSQGKRVANGVAIHQNPRAIVAKHVGGRNYVIEHPGEDGGDLVIIPNPTQDGREAP